MSNRFKLRRMITVPAHYVSYPHSTRRHLVPAHKIPDRGAPGHTPESKRWFQPRGTLGGWKADMSAGSRRRILAHLVSTQGYARTVRKLNALRNVSTNRKVDSVAKADMAYLHRRYRG